MTAEAKRRAAEAKSRGDEAFKRKEFRMAVDDYTQVCYLSCIFSLRENYLLTTSTLSSHPQPNIPPISFQVSNLFFLPIVNLE